MKDKITELEKPKIIKKNIIKCGRYIITNQPPYTKGNNLKIKGVISNEVKF